MECVLGMGMRYKPVTGSLLPWRIVLLCSVMVTPVLVKMAIQSASQRVLMERSELFDNDGKTCAMHADGGSAGILSLICFVEYTVVPLGSDTLICLCVG